MARAFNNPYKPGAGHMPPYLAGRSTEQGEFERLLKQWTITENLVLTGLRGVGKTVLLETFKPIAIRHGWLWVGTDLSESSSVSEDRIAVRLLTDLAVVTSNIVVSKDRLRSGIGFAPEEMTVEQHLTYDNLLRIYKATPGLTSDKLKEVLETVSKALQARGRRGIVFAYDEAQNLADHGDANEYPLSLLLDVFQSLQRKDIPFLLVLTGLPTLFPNLVDARTFAERMFRVVMLNRLSKHDSRDAIEKPIQQAGCPVSFSVESVDTIVDVSGGYPYFIQFICREVFDLFQQQEASGGITGVPVDDILRKLDSDFFAGRWARATDRQRDLLTIVASLPNSDGEFTVQELVDQSKRMLAKPFSNSHANQMLAALCNAGLVYKNRHGKYSFAVPLLGDFIQRQETDN